MHDEVDVLDEGPPDPGRRPSAGALIRPGDTAPATAPVRWMDDGAKLAITTGGSSSAPAVVTGARVEGQRLTLTAEMRNPGGGPVTADLTPYVTVIRTPAGLDPRAPAVVVMGGEEYDLLPASEQRDEPYIELTPASPRPEL